MHNGEENQTNNSKSRNEDPKDRRIILGSQNRENQKAKIIIGSLGDYIEK